jgi:UDP-glucose 4-epimerase
MAEVYPGVPLSDAIHGRQTLLSIGRARDLFGYEPRHSWLDAAG